MSRTTTFVSAARMSPPHVSTKAVLQLGKTPPLRWSFGKYCPVRVLRRGAPGAAHDNLLAVFVPLEHRSRPDAKAPAHFSGNGDLSLCGELRVRDRHP